MTVAGVRSVAGGARALDGGQRRAAAAAAYRRRVPELAPFAFLAVGALMLAAAGSQFQTLYELHALLVQTYTLLASMGGESGGPPSLLALTAGPLGGCVFGAGLVVLAALLGREGPRRRLAAAARAPATWLFGCALALPALALPKDARGAWLACWAGLGFALIAGGVVAWKVESLRAARAAGRSEEREVET